MLGAYLTWFRPLMTQIRDKPMRIDRLIRGLLPLAWFAIATCTGGAAPRVPAGTGSAVKCARVVVTKFFSKKATMPAPELLTNRSAAGIGFVTAIGIDLAVGTASGFSQFSQGEKPHGGNIADKKIQALMDKYGMTGGNDSDPSMKKLQTHGREFYSAVLAIMADPQVAKLLRSGGSPGPTSSGWKGDTNPDHMTFTQVSPTKVKVTAPGSPVTGLNVVLEDDAWRIDMGDIGVGNAPAGHKH